MNDLTVIEHAANIIENRLTPPCDGQLHNINALGHDAEQRASYRVTSPCCRRRFHACASRVLWWWSEGLVACRRCDIQHLVERYQFEPIGDD